MDVWKLLYGFIFELESAVQSYDNYVPRLEDIPYLEDNLMISHKFEQLKFIQELINSHGFIVYSDDYIYDGWWDGNVTDYILVWDEISHAINSVYGVTDDDRKVFTNAFICRFLLVLLDKDPAYDLSTLSNVDASTMGILIAQCIWHLYYHDALQVLDELFCKLRSSKGLYLLQKTCIVLDLIEDAAEEREDYNMSTQITHFLNTIITANLRHELVPEIVEIITDILYHWLIDGLDPNALSRRMQLVAKQLASVDLFHSGLIEELINLHDTYHFILNDHTQRRDQMLFFTRFIAELIRQRNDWNHGPEFTKFMLKLGKSSIQLRPFLSIFASHFNDSTLH